MDETTYEYRDEQGALLYQVVRRPGKQFFQRGPDEQGGWVYNLDGVPRVLYRLPELLSSTEPILWVEGEKDVETLHAYGFCATTCAMGADGWRPEYAEYFRGRCVYALRDNDAPGLKLRERMERDTVPVARAVHRVELPGLAEGEDVTDWFGKTHGGETWPWKNLQAHISGCPRCQARLQEFLTILNETGKVPVSPKPPMPVEFAAAPERRTAGVQLGLPTDLGLPTFPEVAFVGPLEMWRGILRRYTNAPDPFLWMSLMAPWGLALCRRVYVAAPRVLYPGNFYLLLSETARARKSTALWIGSELLKALGVPHLFVRGLGSVEGLYQRMAKAPGTPVLLYVDEFRALLSVAQRKVTENIFPRLNTLWDCPDEDEITKVETVRVTEPTVILVAATPLQYIEDRLSEEHFVGGVLNRYLVLVGFRQKAEAWPPPLNRSVIEPVAERLKPLLDRLPVAGREMVPDPEARELYQDWFDALERRLDTMGDLLESLLSRLPQHVHKVALGYATLLGEERLTLAAYRPALAVAEYVECVATQLFSHVGLTARARLEARVLESIGRGKSTAKAIKNYLGGRVSMDDVNRALDALAVGGSVVRDARKTTKGRPYHVYSLAEEEG